MPKWINVLITKYKIGLMLAGFLFVIGTADLILFIISDRSTLGRENDLVLVAAGVWLGVILSIRAIRAARGK